MHFLNGFFLFQRETHCASKEKALTGERTRGNDSDSEAAAALSLTPRTDE